MNNYSTFGDRTFSSHQYFQFTYFHATIT